MGVLAHRSAHASPSAWPLIDTSRIFSPHMFNLKLHATSVREPVGIYVHPYLSKPSLTYPNISNPIQTFQTLSKPIKIYRTQSKPNQPYPNLSQTFLIQNNPTIQTWWNKSLPRSKPIKNLQVRILKCFFTCFFPGGVGGSITVGLHRVWKSK